MLGNREQVELPVESELRRTRSALVRRRAIAREFVVFSIPRARTGEDVDVCPVSHVSDDECRTRVRCRRVR